MMMSGLSHFRVSDSVTPHKEMSKVWVRTPELSADEAVLVHLADTLDVATVSDVIQASCAVLDFGTAKASQLQCRLPNLPATQSGPANPPLSNRSALGVALEGRKEGDEATFIVEVKPSAAGDLPHSRAASQLRRLPPPTPPRTSGIAPRHVSPTARPLAPAKGGSSAPIEGSAAASRPASASHRSASSPPPPSVRPATARAPSPIALPPRSVPTHRLASPGGTVAEQHRRSASAAHVPMARPQSTRTTLASATAPATALVPRVARLTEVTPSNQQHAARVCGRFVAQWGAPLSCSTCKQHRSLHAAVHGASPPRAAAISSAGKAAVSSGLSPDGGATRVKEGSATVPPAQISTTLAS